MRQISHAVAAVSLSLALAGCNAGASARGGVEQVGAGLGNAVTAPLDDLNLRRQEIPTVLLQAESNPYDLRNLNHCRTIAAEIARLDEALIAIFKAGLLDIRLEAPPLTTTISEKPAASEIARWQASTSAEVTDLRHRTVQLDGPVVRKFVSLLDGSRDQRMLLDAMNAFLDQARAVGSAVPGLPERATAEEVAAHLKDVARLGLLWA